MPSAADDKKEEGAIPQAELATELDLGRTFEQQKSGAVTVRSGNLHKATLAPPSREQRATDSEPRLVASAASYIGFTIDGRYRIDSVLAEGGMGVVYRGTHRVIDKPVAIKILRPDFASDRDVTERFLTEAKAASSIGHASIVDVFDFGELPDGATYLAMELVDGTPLSKLVRGPMPAARVVRLGKQIATGLAAAHDAGIVHRDLKPDNLVVTTRDDGDDFVKILDFGIAKVARSQNRLTRAGTIFGTPQYMSPEQGSGGDVDHRADIYSLGVILYELTAGKLPFDAENPLGLVTQHMYTRVPLISEMDPPPENVPPELEAVVLKCLSKKPEDRYASMVELGADLDAVRDGELPMAVADLAQRRSEEDEGQARFSRVLVEHGRKQRGARWPIWLGGAAVVAAAAYAIAGRGKEPDAPPVPTAESARAPEPRVPSAPRKKHSVAIVVEPIDSHVFHGNNDLGTMPVFVPVGRGERVTVQVRRDGFHTEDVLLDDSRTKVIVRLRPIPGAKLATPVPKSDVDLDELVLRVTLDNGESLADAATPPEAALDGGPRGVANAVMDASAQPALENPSEAPPAPSGAGSVRDAAAVQPRADSGPPSPAPSP